MPHAVSSPCTRWPHTVGRVRRNQNEESEGPSGPTHGIKIKRSLLITGVGVGGNKNTTTTKTTSTVSGLLSSRGQEA